MGTRVIIYLFETDYNTSLSRVESLSEAIENCEICNPKFWNFGILNLTHFSTNLDETLDTKS